jgi:hypothetical protein
MTPRSQLLKRSTFCVFQILKMTMLGAPGRFYRDGSRRKVNGFVQEKTVTNVPGFICCIGKRWSTTALQDASEITASVMAATL